MLKMEISQAREKPSMDIAEATVNLCKNVGEEIAKQDFTRLNKLLHNAKKNICLCFRSCTEKMLLVKYHVYLLIVMF